MQNTNEKLELMPVLDVEGAKAGGGKSRTPVREDDTTATIATLSVLYGLGEGVVRGFGANGWSVEDMKRRVFLDGTPIIAADGSVLHDVELDFRSGTIDQAAIEGMPAVTIETPIGIEVRNGHPVSRSFQREEVSSYDVRISIGRLMRNTLEGDSYKHSVEFAIDVASDSGSFSEYGRYTINEKISQGFQRTYKVALPQGNNRTIRVRKISADADSNLIFNAIVLEAITEVVEVKLRYPHTALLWLRYDARNFSSAPKVEVLLDGKADIQIPLNYNPDTRIYATSGAGTTNGVWNGQFKEGYTDNPVWHWLDLATNKRYGLGNKITIDIPNKFYLYSLAKYCDELVPDGKGGMEPRFTCNNMYLQKQEDAFTVFKDLSSVFRAKTIWDGTHLTPKMDAPRDAMLVFSRANANNISYSSTSDAAQHNVIAVQFYDTENHYESKYAYARSVANIQRRGRVETAEVTALGCTSEGQAQRIANYLLNSELTETELVSFTTGLDGIRPVVGDVFIFADDLMAGKATSGRVVSVAGAQVTLDRELNPEFDLEGTFIANTTESLASTRKIIAISEDKKTVTLDKAIDVVDITGLVWAVKSASVGLREFTLDDISYDADEHTFNVSGILYNRNKYSASDTAANIAAPPFTIIEPFTSLAPLNVVANYYVVVNQGVNVCNIDVSWTQVTTAAKYEVEMRRDGAEWRKLGTTQGLSLTVDNAYAGQYEFRVRAFDVRGNASVYTTSGPVLVQGKVLPPPALSEFRATGELMAVRAEWVYPPNTMDSLSVSIEYTSEPPEVVNRNTQIIHIPYPATSYVFSGLSAHVTLWLRAAIVDRYGNAGEYTGWVSAAVDTDPDKLIELISGHISEGTLDQVLKGKLDGISAAASNAQAEADAARIAASNALQAAVDGITTVTNAYTQADLEIQNQLTTYKASNDNAVAGILQKAETAVGAAQSATNLIGLLESRVTGLDGSKLNASVITNYYTKTETTNAIAGQITAYKATVDTALGSKLNASVITNYSTKADTAAAIASVETTLRSEMVQGVSLTNLINFAALTAGYYRATGSIAGTTADADAYDPNYYACTPGQKFATTLYDVGPTPYGLEGRMVWYTQEKAFIGADNTHNRSKVGVTVTVTAPANAAFYRYCVISKDSNISMVTGEGAVEIRETTAAVNGSTAAKVVTVDNNGVLSGYGLMSEIVNGQVTSQFGINADNFFIGAPSNNKKPFVVLTSNGQINGVTVPAGTYIDTTYIGNATIKDVHIANAAIKTAKIDNLAVTAAKIANATITSAEIANAAISTANIEDAAISTLKVQGNAITANAAAYFPDEIVYSQYDSEFEIASLTMNAAGGRVIIHFSIDRFRSLLGSAGSDPRVIIRFKRGSTVIRTFTFSGAASRLTGDIVQQYGPEGYYNAVEIRQGVFLYQYTFPVILDTPPSGNQTYSITVERRGMNAGGVNGSSLHTYITGRSLMLLGAKK